MMLCAVKSCRTTSESGEIFEFPEEDSLKQQWLNACSLRSSDISPKHGLCHIHFKSDQIQIDPSSGRSKPSFGSVPSLFLEVDPDMELFYHNNDSHYNRVRKELEKDSSRLETITHLLTVNEKLQKKASLYLKKQTDLEMGKVRQFLDMAEQNAIADQLLKMNKRKPFQLKKANTIVDFGENGLVLKDSGVVFSPGDSQKLAFDASFKEVSNLLETVEAVKFASDILNKDIFGNAK
ncbi:uncharacterized protein [Bemisia tabaci]|nr:PREDICTED: uncharacterized protein LOC109044137 isoform X2 [Bemisia tabaci]